MPVIAVILSALMGWIVFWLIRFDGVEVIASYFSAAGRQRRMQRARDAEAKAAARSVTEARDGALALLIKLGSVDHALLPGAKAIIDDAASNVFGYGDKLVEHRTFAEYVARNTPSFSVLFRELTPVFEKQLSAPERQDFLDLLHEVAEAAGGLTPVREAMIDEVKAKLLPQRPARA